MTDDRPPIFTSFDDAWRSFTSGGALTPMDEWRQRFTAGRGQLLSFEAPIADTPIADAIEDLQDELDGIDGLLMFEREMLHVSIRGVGFQVIAKARPDDVSREDVGRITQQAAGLVRGMSALDIAAGPLNVFPGALILEVRDGGQLAELRQRLAATSDDAFGIAATQYLPHITIAMFDDPAAAAPALRERLPALRGHAPATAAIKRIELARWWFTGADTDLPERDPVRAYRLKA